MTFNVFLSCLTRFLEHWCQQNGGIVEWTEVLPSESVQNFVDENGNLVLNSLRHAQLVEADKRVGDVVGSTEMK